MDPAQSKQGSQLHLLVDEKNCWNGQSIIIVWIVYVKEPWEDGKDIPGTILGLCDIHSMPKCFLPKSDYETN